MARKNLYKNNWIGKVLVTLLIVWVGFALIRTINNFSKVFTEEIGWVKLSTEQKYRRLYGELYDYLKFVNINTSKGSKTLIYSYDGKPYFYGRYFLYPKLLYQATSLDNFITELQTGKYDYFTAFIVNNQDMQKLNTIFAEKHAKVVIFNNNSFIAKLK